MPCGSSFARLSPSALIQLHLKLKKSNYCSTAAVGFKLKVLTCGPTSYVIARGSEAVVVLAYRTAQDSFQSLRNI